MEYCPFLLQSAGGNPADLLAKLVSMDFEIKFVDETEGVLQPEAGNLASVTSKLLKQKTYMNIICVRS